MSPWAALTGTEGSMTSNEGSDIIGTKCLNDWGRQILEGLPVSYLPYIEPIRAPETWFKSMNIAVDRVLITAGSAECLRDPIEVLAKQICHDHDGATFWMQENGVHIDPFLDFFLEKVKIGTLTQSILEWFATGFEAVSL